MQKYKNVTASIYIRDPLSIPSSNEISVGYTGVIRWSVEQVGKLVNVCVSNSFHSYQVIPMKLAKHGLFKVYMCMTYFP